MQLIPNFAALSIEPGVEPAETGESSLPKNPVIPASILVPIPASPSFNPPN